MKGPFRLGKYELYWLNGGEFELDGGAMFGVVPKVLWSKKYPCDEENYIPMVTWPILIKYNNNLVLIETGLGNKLTDKQRQIYHVKKDWAILEELKILGIDRRDINFVILTHFDFDHAGGIVMYNSSGELELTFPRAKHILQKMEWEDVLNPNKRSINTFWKINYEKLIDTENLFLIDGDFTVFDGLELIRTGGHNRGHQIVIIKSDEETAVHFGDLMPMHVHYNPLWVMAFDNYPVESIKQKEIWEKFARDNNAWITFYHDPFILAAKFDEKGNIINQWPV